MALGPLAKKSNAAFSDLSGDFTGRENTPSWFGLLDALARRPRPESCPRRPPSRPWRPPTSKLTSTTSKLTSASSNLLQTDLGVLQPSLFSGQRPSGRGFLAGRCRLTRLFSPSAGRHRALPRARWLRSCCVAASARSRTPTPATASAPYLGCVPAAALCSVAAFASRGRLAAAEAADASVGDEFVAGRLVGPGPHELDGAHTSELVRVLGLRRSREGRPPVATLVLQ